MDQEKPLSRRCLITAGLTALALCLAVEVVRAFVPPAAACAAARCSTDSECLALCPADDMECDGGPDTVSGAAREQVRLCREDAAHCTE